MNVTETPMTFPSAQDAASSLDLSKHKPAAGTSLETTRSVARRLGCSVRTVQRWVKSGILPVPLRVNKRSFFPAHVMPRPDLPETA
jgi:hypothetical protein